MLKNYWKGLGDLQRFIGHTLRTVRLDDNMVPKGLWFISQIPDKPSTGGFSETWSLSKILGELVQSSYFQAHIQRVAGARVRSWFCVRGRPDSFNSLHISGDFQLPVFLQITSSWALCSHRRNILISVIILL